MKSLNFADYHHAHQSGRKGSDNVERRGEESPDLCEESPLVWGVECEESSGGKFQIFVAGKVNRPKSLQGTNLHYTIYIDQKQPQTWAKSLQVNNLRYNHKYFVSEWYEICTEKLT